MESSIIWVVLKGIVIIAFIATVVKLGLAIKSKEINSIVKWIIAVFVALYFVGKIVAVQMFDFGGLFLFQS